MLNTLPGVPVMVVMVVMVVVAVVVGVAGVPVDSTARLLSEKRKSSIKYS